MDMITRTELARRVHALVGDKSLTKTEKMVRLRILKAAWAKQIAAPVPAPVVECHSNGSEVIELNARGRELHIIVRSQ